MHKFTPTRRLTGGLRLPPQKERSTALPILRGLIPRKLTVSTRQHRGSAARATVQIGQQVRRGEPIARADTTRGADVHAPTSGTVVGIESREIALATAVTRETCIVIESDGEDRAFAATGPISLGADTEARIAQLATAGIVGLGGAVYPTAAKVDLDPQTRCRLLIINGAECEPYISCDDMLMREASESVVDGAEILRQIVGAQDCVIAIERDKPQAIDAIAAAADRLRAEVSIAELPSIYPAGGERQLVDVLGGVQIPSDQVPGASGFLCQNVGTVYAIHRYFRHAEPLTSRIVTVTGSAVARPQNVAAMIGTPISDLIASCGGYRGSPAALVHGGSMMGVALESDDMPVTKATNCIIVAGESELAATQREWPCIRCGECATSCPASLQPQDLLSAARRGDAQQLLDLDLSECIECGCCDIVCPSHIPLTQIFKEAKLVVGRHLDHRKLAAVADQRYQLREQRRDEIRESEARQREAVKHTLGDEASRAAELAAAVARARRRKHRTEDD